MGSAGDVEPHGMLLALDPIHRDMNISLEDGAIVQTSIPGSGLVRAKPKLKTTHYVLIPTIPKGTWGCHGTPQTKDLNHT